MSVTWMFHNSFYEQLCKIKKPFRILSLQQALSQLLCVLFY